jgi:nucleoside phosphorylase
VIASHKWVEENLGFNPLKTPAPATTLAVQATATARATDQDFQREIIDFDSEGPEGQAFLAFSTATGLSRFTDIPWPKALAPRTDQKARRGEQGGLPKSDALVVTWTVDEGHALSRVLTPGKDSRNDYLSYKHNFKSISATMSARSPAVQAGRLGTYWTTNIGAKKVVIFKSDSHLSQDTRTLPRGNALLPNAQVWEQIISEVDPKLVITTGTSGGIGKACEVGDVTVSPIVRFDSENWLKRAQFAKGIYRDGSPDRKYFSQAKKLFKANSAQLPKTNTRAPRILVATNNSNCVVTTDFFGFDTSDNHYGLKGLGSVCEMGDAVLGLVAQRMGKQAPPWVAVRNVSDPQIKAEGSLTNQKQLAAQIYKGFGRWSTVCSAIVCWALIAA